MNIKEFLAAVEQDRQLEAEKARQRQKETDDLWEACSDAFDSVGVPRRSRFGRKRDLVSPAS